MQPSVFDLTSRDDRHPRRLVTAIAYVIAYLVALLSCVAVWSSDPTLLYIGRDADFSVWLAAAYKEWGYPFGVTTLNPFQGMGSMLISINPYFNPGAWIFQTDLRLQTKFVISMVVYFVEITATAFLLARALGFSRAFAFAAALWLVILALPPFNFIFGLQGTLATSPQWGNVLAIYNLILTLFVLIGKSRWRNRGPAFAVAANLLFATGVVVLLLASLLAGPFYSAGTMASVVLLLGVILVSSEDYPQAIWRTATLIGVGTIFYALGMADFFLASKALTARFADSGAGEVGIIPQLRWPIEWSRATFASAKEWLCAAAVLCGRLAVFPGSLTGAYWLHVAIISGGIVAYFRAPSPLSRVGGWFALLWTGLLVFWLARALGLISELPVSPIYFVVAMQPFWAFFSLYAIWTLLQAIAMRLIGSERIKSAVLARPRATAYALPAAAATSFLLLAAAYGIVLPHRAPSVWYFPQRGAFEQRRSGPIVERLRREIAIRPGDVFRGSVASIFGAKGSSLRKSLGIADGVPLAAGQFEQLLSKVRAATGNDHDLLDLWWFGIPTVSEYAQGVTRPFSFYIVNFLSDPGDPNEISLAFPRRANVDVLRAMGVRFVVTDQMLSDPHADFLLKEDIGGASIYLYELANPNLGNFSPVNAEAYHGSDSLRAAIEKDPDILASHAFVAMPPGGPLVPAQHVRMTFEKGGVHVTAASDGLSLVLLPLQFSHCWRVADPSVRVARANLLFTSVLFNRTLDIRLEWHFSFWRESQCRMSDVADLRTLGLLR